MQGFWIIKFTDGTKGYCQGHNAYDAVRIAEKLTGKTADVGGNKWKPELKTLPYPANVAPVLLFRRHPVIWQLDHPVSGKCPSFCFSPDKCGGHTSCPQNRSCTE